MKRLAYPRDKNLPYLIIIIVYTLYVILSALLYRSAGVAVEVLAIIPVIGAGWYFGFSGGLFIAILCVSNDIIQQVFRGHFSHEFPLDSGTIIVFLVLTFTAFAVGKFKTVIEESSQDLLKLKQYEHERQSHTDFLVVLNQITAGALEADSLDSTLKILIEKIGKLFKADDCFFDLWDEAKGMPIAMTACGPMSDVYSYIKFEPGEHTPTTFAIECGRPTAIEDLHASPVLDSEVAKIFPSCSMLVLPLIVQNRKLGALLLGYNKIHSPDKNELVYATLAAEQVALVLSKSLILAEERKQIKQLTALHDIALISIHADNEDELLSCVTDVIGQTLSLDHFSILLPDEAAGVLRAHPSYRLLLEASPRIEIPLGQGITGQVAKTGKAQRIGNVRSVKEYVDVNERTISELCVPIKFKEQVLGVINAESTKWDAFTEEDERLLITLAGQIATAMEQIRVAQAERKWLHQLAHSHDLTFVLTQITTQIEKALSMDDIIQDMTLELGKISLTWIMAIYDKESDTLTIRHTSMKPEFLEIVEKGLKHPLTKFTFSRNKLNSNDLLHPLTLSDPVDEIEAIFTGAHRQSILDILAKIGVDSTTDPLRLPLMIEENLLGILWIWGKGLTRMDLSIMSLFAKQIGVSLERVRLFQEVQNLALTDPLTGLQNRRSIFELGKTEFSRASRMNRPLCCMLLDLDHFKQVNDVYGHPVGDQVLKEFANRCKFSVREIDLVGRYGGEELIILLPEADKKAAMQIAERLRTSVAATPFKVADLEIAVTVSIGVAAKDGTALHLETLIEHADQAMYLAKQQGRNRVVMNK